MAAREPTPRSANLLSSPCSRGRVLIVAMLTMALASCDGDTLFDSAGPDPNQPGGPTGPADVRVIVDVHAPDRFELTDSILIRVEAWDPNSAAAISRVGFGAVITDSETGDEIARTANQTFAVAPRDTVSGVFTVDPDWVGAAELPADFGLEVYGWAVNTAGRCAVAIPEVLLTFACLSTQVDNVTLTIADPRGEQMPLKAVVGRTTKFPTSTIVVGDLQVDTLRGLAYLSNRLSNRLHLFRPSDFTWSGEVTVGSEPWGMHMNSTGDTLLVANSGGTSVSRVNLVGTPTEVVGARIQTRNTALFEVDYEVDEDSLPDGTVVADTLAEGTRFLDFSDRPQYLSQDSQGRVLYSTRPTIAEPRGTVRIITNQPGWDEHYTRMLARLPLDAAAKDGTIAILNADSVRHFLGGFLEIWDHPMGFPSQPFSSGIDFPLDALRAITANPISDVEGVLDGEWTLDAISFKDTTYVATSRDRNFVAFGDGGEPLVGRVVMWNSVAGEISSRLLMADLVNNASERVRSLHLNRDGSLGMARGTFGSYFFSNELRLRGTVPEFELGGGGGELHPDHPDTPAPGASGPTTVAFTISGDRSIRIVDTVHYTERGRIPIRDDLHGSTLRVTPPLPSDNNGQGRSCAGSDCVVAKVFAVTQAGGVLVVDVRASDISAQP